MISYLTSSSFFKSSTITFSGLIVLFYSRVEGGESVLILSSKTFSYPKVGISGTFVYIVVSG